MRTTKWVTVAAVVLMVLGFIGSAGAQQHTKKFTLYLSTSDTGVTTPVGTALSGVTDPMVIYNGGDYKRRATDTTLNGLSSLPSGNAILYIDEVTVSQAQLGLGGTYTGNTFFVCAKFGHAGSNFALLEKIPLTSLDLPLSGNTAHGIPFNIPAGAEKAQFFFGPSGITAYGHFKGTLIVGLSGSAWQPPSPILISSSTYAFGTSGTTTMNTTYPAPDGTRWVEIQPLTDAIHISDDGTTPTTNDFKIAAEAVLGVPIDEYRKLQFIPGGTSAGRGTNKFWTAAP
jgi:hypothetical protein